MKLLIKTESINLKKNYISNFLNDDCKIDDVENSDILNKFFFTKVNKKLSRIKNNCDVCPLVKQTKLKFKKSHQNLNLFLMLSI